MPDQPVVAPQASAFAAGDLATLAAAREVRIETRAGPEAPVHRTIVWVVVDDDEVFVRSYRGARGRWYRELVAFPSGALIVGRERLPARALDAGDPSGIERCSRALKRKYGSDPSLPFMLVPEVLPTTLRLVPEEADVGDGEGRREG